MLHQGPDETVLQEFIENNEALGGSETLSWVIDLDEHGKVKEPKNMESIVGEAFYDAETGDEDELQDVFMDAHGLLFELEKELNILLCPKFTHIAIGLAFT